MNSLANPWCSVQVDNRSPHTGGGRRCKVQVKTYIPRHSDGVDRRRELRNRQLGKLKGNVTKFNGKFRNDTINTDNVKNEHCDCEIDERTADALRDVDISDPSFCKDSSVHNHRKPEQSVGTAAILLTPLYDDDQAVRGTRLHYQDNNRAEPLRKILLAAEKDGIQRTPFRHRLTTEDPVLSTRSENAETTVSTHLETWTERASLQVREARRNGLFGESDQESREFTPITAPVSQSVSESCVYNPELSYPNTAEMKTQDSLTGQDDRGFLPVIDIAAGLRVCDRSGMTPTETRATVAGFRAHKHTSPPRKSSHYMDCGYISGVQITDNVDQPTSKRKAAKVSSPTPVDKTYFQTVTSSYAKGNYQSPPRKTKTSTGRHHKKKGTCNVSPAAIKTSQVVCLPPLNSSPHAMVTSPGNGSMPTQSDPPKCATKEPAFIRIAPRGSIPSSEQKVTYNQVGTSSKVGTPKTYTLQQLADIQHGRNSLFRDNTSDRLLRSQIERNQRVFDLASYDNFARKLPKKRNSPHVCDPDPLDTHETHRAPNTRMNNILTDHGNAESGSVMSSVSNPANDITANSAEYNIHTSDS